VKRISKIALTLVTLFSIVEFVRSNTLFYSAGANDLDLAGRIGNSGSILLLAFVGLVWLNKKESTNE
jgi:hypothetical protein